MGRLDSCISDGNLPGKNRWLWLLVSGDVHSFLDKEGPLGFTIIVNIDKRLILEPELKKLNDNQEAIMHMVAHDLKSPLFNIKLAAGLLKENLKKLLAQDHQKQDQTLT